MKIRDVTIVPLTSTFVMPHTPPEHCVNGVRNCVWLRIDTDEGLTGWGETYCGCYATEVAVAALRRLSRRLIGKDISDPAVTLEEMRFDNRYWAMRGIGAQCTSAIEAAFWDICGQAQNIPVWKLLGDGEPHRVLAYASAGLNSLSPDEIHQEVKGFVEQGFRAYKINVLGNQTDLSDRLAVDTERIAAAREALGPDRLLFVDMGVPQSRATIDFDRAAAYIRAIAPYKIGFLEEPAMTYDVETYGRLQALGQILIAGGESFTCPEEFEPFFDAGALGVAQPDAAVVGGPASCVELIKHARKCGVSIALHAWCAGVGLAQNLHAACSLKDGVMAMECPIVIHPVATEPLRDIWRFDDGYLLPPLRPGLGITITPELLRKNAYKPDAERDY